MTFKRIHKLSLWVSILSMLTFYACHRDPKITPEENKARNTLLIYMAGDNSLSNYVDKNINQSIEGLLIGKSQNLNLVIFKDKKGAGYSELFRLRYNEEKQRVDTASYYAYDRNLNAALPETLEAVVKKVFTEYDTPVKGLMLWSHALSWLPLYVNSYTSTARTRALQFIGQDGNSWLDLWDINTSLQKVGVHFDYIMMDACHVATAEVAYELRDRTDYLLCPVMETMGEGFPYTDMMPILDACKTASDVEQMLEKIHDTYQDLYSTGGALALLKTSAMDAFAMDFKSALDNHTEQRALMKDTANHLQDEMQQFGRAVLSNQDLFFDMEQYIRLLTTGSATGTNTEASHLIDLLQDVVIRHYSSETFDPGDYVNSALTIKTSCGLSVTIPEFFGLRTDGTLLLNAYRYTQWGKYMGY